MHFTEEEFRDYTKHMLEMEDTFKFTCSQCGECCRNREDPIIITGVDIFHIAKALKITPAAVIENYTRGNIGPNSRMPIVTLAERADGSCKLLRKGKCTVHSEKPVVCAIYPLGRMLAIRKLDTAGIDKETSDKFKLKEYRYFMQPLTCGNSTNEEHTLKEWLDSFNIQARDDECIAWTELFSLLSEMAIFFEKENFSPKSMDTFRYACFMMLYAEYTTDRDYMEQLKEQTAKAMQLQDLINDHKDHLN